jgi:hypothetical protein
MRSAITDNTDMFLPDNTLDADDIALDADAVSAANTEVIKYVWTSAGNERNHAGGVGPASSDVITEAAATVFVTSIATIEAGKALINERVAS